MSDLLILGAVVFAFATSVYGYIKARSNRKVIEDATRQIREANAYMEGLLKGSTIPPDPRRYEDTP